MKRPDLETAEKVELIKYIEYLEGCLNGSSELILSLNTASRVFAKDLNMICEGEATEWVADEDKDVIKSNLTLLSGDAKDKTFERIMVLFDKFDKIKALSQYFKGMPIQQTEAKRLKLPPGGNIYEHVVKELKNGRTRV
jgi:hypothetical protein